MRLTFASYNIHKAVGMDRRRDPGRIVGVIEELDADVVALQEVDERFGARRAVLDRDALAQAGYQVASKQTRPASMGWHGNALLVRDNMEIVDIDAHDLPQVEPRGAIRATLRKRGQDICVTGMHLDLSGLRRKRQFAHVCNASRAPGLPAVMLGDCNEWLRPFGGTRGLAAHWEMVEPGRSFPSRRPMLSLDRVVHTSHWTLESADVHASALARQASDHLPIKAVLALHDS